MVVVYEMDANRPGKIRISDIKIDTKNGSTKVQDILINVVEQEKRDKQGDVFVLAILERSSILKEMVESGAIGIAGGNYDVSSGEVEFYSDATIIK